MLILNKKINNKQIYLSKEYKQFVVFRVISWLAVGLFIAGTIISVSFIYQSTFFTIEKIQSLLSQEDDGISEVIDFEKYEKVKKTWEEKNQSTSLRTNFKVLFDPFYPPTSTVSTITLKP